MTGRGAGYCAGYATPGYANPVVGGFGFGRGGGRGRGGWGRRNQYYATGLTGWQRAGYPAAVPSAVPYAGVPYTQTKEQQADMLKGQAEYFEDQLSGIRKRIDELDAEKK
jgi:hypothetical protein